ncbi:segregation/condensation protein A [Pelagicoccus sp. SDUM812003]|uniref:segregation and condensation protein A n=1 Tax=Pelagicoccus sp. SDUM812003 TaxID=3041267 RepID=UPI00280E744E|nr:segregation/condensation protein A [Pelagicoccus sp. SDUM812003]MDQ8205136.1 segregation/condensation protein A [Pelagicoccus sp. SDUM812003]
MEADTDPRIKLSVFEGPLDLLLFLIRKHEIDVYDIPIELVLDQYLAVINSMQQVKLEVAGDFFVMAATLMEIKSRLLLPKQKRAASTEDDEDDDIDPRWELVHQLLEYKKFKEAADTLDKLSDRAALFKERDYASINKQETPVRPLKPEDKISVWNSYNIVLRRLTEKLVIGEIKDDAVTVVDQMELLIEKIKTTREFTFTSLFDGPISLKILVVTFIAILELTRLKRLKVQQDAAFSDFIVTGLEGGETLSFEDEKVLDQLPG